MLSFERVSVGSRLLLVTVLVTSIATASIFINTVYAEKSCREKKWSDCSGTKGWYTHHGNHHCFKWEKDCYDKAGHGEHYKG